MLGFNDINILHSCLRLDVLPHCRAATLGVGLSVRSSSPGHPRWDVSDLLSWVQCFGVYTAVEASTRRGFKSYWPTRPSSSERRGDEVEKAGFRMIHTSGNRWLASGKGMSEGG